MKFFRCPYLEGSVKLTDERERHIAQGHPDLLPDHLSAIEETLAEPDEIRRFASRGIWDLVDEGTAVFSRQYANPLGIVVVIVILDVFDAPWIITAYVTQYSPRGQTVYERDQVDLIDCEEDPWFDEDDEPWVDDEVEEEDWVADEEEVWASYEDDAAEWIDDPDEQEVCFEDEDEVACLVGDVEDAEADYADDDYYDDDDDEDFR